MATTKRGQQVFPCRRCEWFSGSSICQRHAAEIEFREAERRRKKRVGRIVAAFAEAGIRVEDVGRSVQLPITDAEKVLRLIRLAAT